jgi:hypothetical protein
VSSKVGRSSKEDHIRETTKVLVLTRYGGLLGEGVRKAVGLRVYSFALLPLLDTGVILGLVSLHPSEALNSSGNFVSDANFQEGQLRRWY